MTERKTNTRTTGQQTRRTSGHSRSNNKSNINSRPRRNNSGNRRYSSGNTARSSKLGGKKAMRRPRTAPPRKPKENNDPIPPIGNNIRIIPLGGVEEVGKNMTAIEVGEDIILVDAGFQFKDETTPGIDYILPNTKYLEDKKDRIRGMFITHGHLDHIGALPYIVEKVGNPTIYSREFGAIMIQKRHEEFPHLPKLDIKILDGDETVSFGDNLKVETFAISHTIPDSMGLVIKTHMGDIVFIEDVRVDNIDGVPTEEEVDQYKRFKDQDVLLLTMDSTSVEKPGWSLSENVVVENIEKIIKETSGRLIIGTFASQVERILAVIEAAHQYGKKVVVEGRSMKSNLEIIKHLKLLKNPETVIPMSEMDNLPPDKLVMLVTGAQGEEFAALNRMANGSHKHIKLKEEDTILLSSSIIPTNHASVVRLKDRLFRSKAKIITYLDSDVHASGHGNREELAWIHDQINYKYFIPLHGNHYMVRQHAELSQALGTPKENAIVPDNGSIIEISDGGNKIEKLPMRVPHDVVTVDGFSVSDIQEVVLRDRQLLSEAGIFVIVASINTRTGKLKKSPDIISRGFVYLRESQDLLHEARNLIRRSIERQVKGKKQIDFEKVKKNVSDELTKFLFQKTAKEPLVIPVILGV
jgi:ribonuclease J